MNELMKNVCDAVVVMQQRTGDSTWLPLSVTKRALSFLISPLYLAINLSSPCTIPGCVCDRPCYNGTTVACLRHYMGGGVGSSVGNHLDYMFEGAGQETCMCLSM